MWNSQPQDHLMEFMESEPEGPIEFLEGMLDNRSQCEFFGQNQDVRNQKLFEKSIDNFMPISCSEKIQIKQEQIENWQVEQNEQDCQKPTQIPQAQQNFLKIQSQNRSTKARNKCFQKQKRTTRCTSKVEYEEVVELDDGKNLHTFVAECAGDNEITIPQSNKAEKSKKKIEKHIFREANHFKKSFKISFPKKIVEMFINHYERFFQEDSDILRYNNQLKQRLKQNKKNDYTFDKEVSQILGQNKQIQADFRQRISDMNRRVFSRIVRQKMKEQVIMRDKISQNRELYMIQLKVYALRCRSHRLAKKGTFK